MKQGFLSQYFDGIAVKTLSAVEANILCSHQHEFNGVDGMKKILGRPEGRMEYKARFIYISDNEDDFTTDAAYLTWYDARRKARVKSGGMRYEYRLYFPDNNTLNAAQTGDMLIIARNRDNSLLAIVAAKDSTAARQICWMFGFGENLGGGLSIRSEAEMDAGQIGLAERFILEQLGIVVEVDTPGDLELVLSQFGPVFPATTIFSDFVRGLMPKVTSLDDPDAALLAWMEREEVLYRALERHLLVEDLNPLMQGQDKKSLDPEPIISIVQSTLQRRKSRAGAALENHLEKIFQEHGISYTRTGVTENRLKPDFIFPSIGHYHDAAFPADSLTMLGAKTTCKDRWRQILNEAARVPNKHLITIEPSISEYQTKEMKLEKVQLVVPAGLHDSYSEKQRNWLMPVTDFASMVKERAQWAGE